MCAFQITIIDGCDMGMIECHWHGTNPFGWVCSHIQNSILGDDGCESVEHREYTSSDPDFTGLKFGFWACRGCIAKQDLPPTGSVVNEDGFVCGDRIQGLLHPMCPFCLNEWRERFNIEA